MGKSFFYTFAIILGIAVMSLFFNIKTVANNISSLFTVEKTEKTEKVEKAEKAEKG